MRFPKHLGIFTLFLNVLVARGAVVYQHDFGTVDITGKPYTAAPVVVDAHIQAGSTWDTSASGFTSYAGRSGKALSLSNSSGTPTFTLSFSLDAGYTFALESFSFWRQRSTNGAQNWTLSMNGTVVGSGSVPTTGADTGSLTPSTPLQGLTGTITVVLALSGASEIGTFRLDDFTLNGLVENTSTPNATVTITAPAVAAVTVAHDVDSLTIAGTCVYAVGDLLWTNTLTAVGGRLVASANWSIPAIALAVGCNPVAVSGTNALGVVAADSVTITRFAPGLAPGSVALIGWDDGNDAFAFVTLTELPAGTVLHFTDSGWTGTQYRVSEDLRTLTLNAPLVAGTVIQSGTVSNAFTWSGSGALQLSASGDQIAVFQSTHASPRANPEANIFVLDDTGAFEIATDSNTGGMPSGLTEGVTAVTFDQKDSGQKFMAFTNFPGRALRQTEWLTAIADPANWEYGASGTLPISTFTVLPPPLLSATSIPALAGSVQGVGRHDAGGVVRLSAIPAPGWLFSHWEDGSKAPTRDYTMPAADATVTAIYGWKGTMLLLR
jgi:hypothetical protein